MTQNFSFITTDPSLKDVLNVFKKELFLSINCHHIGTVQSFNSTTQTVKATINYKKTFFEMNKLTGKYDSVLKDYPILIDCPIIILGGGPSHLTFPITKGDECLLLFNDRDIDNWYQGNAGAPNATPRLHSFSDAIALIGVNSAPHVVTSYDTTRAVLSNGTTLVGIGASLIKIANNSYTLNGLLQTLITDVKALVTATAAITVTCATAGNPSSPPINVAAINNVTTQLTSVANQIGQLLE